MDKETQKLLDEQDFDPVVKELVTLLSQEEKDKLFRFLLLSMDYSKRHSVWPESVCHKCLSDRMKRHPFYGHEWYCSCEYFDNE